jgi:tRNA (mo5U34)-methyltransferase
MAFDLSSYYTGLGSIEGNDVFNRWRDELPVIIDQELAPDRHGKLPVWRHNLADLPQWPAAHIDCQAGTVKVEAEQPPEPALIAALERRLRQFMPWRKGPFDIHGVFVDSEWRSDWKWDRLKDHIRPLKDRLALDVGCGNGYHCWRMAGAGARAVLGIDPTPLYVMQYLAVQHFMRSSKAFVLPLALENLPPNLRIFDTVFSMGVLYHRRSPIDHLIDLRNCLAPGGELVLETLVIDGGEGVTLMPEDRYARMRNVWFIPSRATLESWLRRCGFTAVRLVDVSVTSTGEQRVTSWSGDASLRDFLDPMDSRRTVEGYPAPKRAIFLASNP